MQSLEKKDSDLSPEEMNRFARHLTLPEIGLKGQKLLKSSSVICVGSGGLGSPLLLYLAAAGVGRIGIADFDLVEESNLQRQVIHGVSWLGKPKTASARSRIHEINPKCQVDLYNKRITKENVLEIISPYDIVCDCTDNFPSRYLLNDASVLLRKPNIYGSVQGFEGQASVFNLDETAPNFRDLIPNPPPPELIPSCEAGGVVGVLPGLIGMVQATEVIKIITKIGSPLSGRLLIVNALTMNFKELKLEPDQDRKPIEQLIDYEKFCAVRTKSDNQISSAPEKDISVKSLKTLIDERKEDILLLDVRLPHEAKTTSIAGSKLVPLKEIENSSTIEYLKRITLTRKLYVICKRGGRSSKAIQILKNHGIQGINVNGGMDAWTAEIIP